MTEPTTVGTGTIYERIARVQATVADIPTNKTASITSQRTGGTYSFDYMTKGLLEKHVRELFAPEGVAVIVSEEAIRQDSNRCIITIAITLAVSAEEMVVIRRSAYGNDDSDKGVAKAGTTAVRLALADLLLQGGDDFSEDDNVEYRPHVPGQALQAGDRPASKQQLTYAVDLIMRAHLDKAMPDANHALLRLARPVAQSEIGPGEEVVDAIRLIPQNVMSKLIERLEIAAKAPKGAKQVWDQVAEWEVANGYKHSVNPEDTKIEPSRGGVPGADGTDLPF